LSSPTEAKTRKKLIDIDTAITDRAYQLQVIRRAAPHPAAGVGAAGGAFVLVAAAIGVLGRSLIVNGEW
jgi:hypothetical protein